MGDAHFKYLMEHCIHFKYFLPLKMQNLQYSLEEIKHHPYNQINLENLPHLLNLALFPFSKWQLTNFHFNFPKVKFKIPKTC